METRTIKLRLRSWGKAPKRHGTQAYKFSIGDRGVLKRNGWTLLASGRTCEYFAPPVGQSGKDTICMAIVPTDGEIQQMALTMHQAGQSVVQEVEGWIVVYQKTSQASLVQVDLLNKGERIGPSKSVTIPAWFEFGMSSSWRIRMSWEDGDDAPPHRHKYEENVISENTHILQNVLFLEEADQDVINESVEAQSEALREGEVQQEVVNTYERNPEARRQCIRHYGVNCVICGFNFAESYGEIGEGFIHVHHLKPLSEIGGEYEVDPIRDLRPVCPNCHTMLHGRIPPYSLDELQSLLNKSYTPL